MGKCCGKGKPQSSLKRRNAHVGTPTWLPLSNNTQVARLGRNKITVIFAWLRYGSLPAPITQSTISTFFERQMVSKQVRGQLQGSSAVTFLTTSQKPIQVETMTEITHNLIN